MTEPVVPTQVDPNPASAQASPPEQVPVQQEPPAPEPEQDAQKWSPEAQREIEKLRKENASWRTKYRDAEPIVKAHAEAEERNKTELQRATERAQQYERDLAASQQQIQLLGFAAKYGIPEDDYDLLGSGTPEEMESRAVRIAHMREAAIGQQQAPSAPPSQRPLESLRPGASPTPPPVADHSYPEAWRPASWGRNEERTR
jgi:hypothetical protein